MSDKSIEEILRDAIIDADEKLVIEAEGGPHVFSKRFERKIARMKKLYFKNGKYMGEIYAKRAAAVRRIAACICCVILGAAMAVTVRAYGGEVVDWIVSIGTTSTDINFEILDYDAVPATIEKKYTLAELPEGYELVNEVGNDRINTLKYTNSGNPESELLLTQFCYSAFKTTFDTENAAVSTEAVGACRYYYVEKGEGVAVLWENGEYCFTLSSTGGFTLEEMKTLTTRLIEYAAEE
ncbi:MAG: DUF4367 domain-containing protein [Clostridia bacterium]|nr:DUF4367 domain-containing protein [Clostridia bacterium]